MINREEEEEFMEWYNWHNSKSQDEPGNYSFWQGKDFSKYEVKKVPPPSLEE